MMGKVIMSGIVPQLKAPFTGILASELAVGSIVKLMENGSPVEYLVVNQGKPSGSSLYDSSCDGLWLLRKDIHSNRQFGTSNIYSSALIHTWLNGDFLAMFDSVTQAAIKQAKIPYRSGPGGTLISGANGLSTKVFLLGGYEVGFTEETYSGAMIEDGACLDYFSDCSPTAAESKRIGYLSGTASFWWIRIPYYSGNYEFGVTETGVHGAGAATDAWGVRPALILPKAALFDEETMILKGVA